MHVYENPFRRAIKVLKDEHEESKNRVKNNEIRQKERWIENQKESFKLPQPKKEEKKPSGSMSSLILNDYY